MVDLRRNLCTHLKCFLLFVLLSTDLQGFIDLDSMKQPFVLETKRLLIRGHPDAFNPSIVRIDGKLLMCFRSRNRIDQLADLIGFIWLDEDFNPQGNPCLLEMEEGGIGTYIQDPRLFVIKDKLFMAYSALVENSESEENKRMMCLAEIKYDENYFLAVNSEYLSDFQGDKDRKCEKNWVPMDYQGLMLLAYTISPHKIFLPVAGEKRCVTIAQSLKFTPWNWGELRGGTPALPVGNSYLAFFHSSTSIASVQSDYQNMTHYFMGAYLFEKEPPFSLQKISPVPIVSYDFYNGETHSTWKPLRVVFPCGFVCDEKHIWVSYGRQDHEAWIVKLDKIGLLKSMTTLESQNY